MKLLIKSVSPSKSKKKTKVGGCEIHCQDCSISQLCIPYSLGNQDMNKLDKIIERKKPIQKGEEIFQAGDKLTSLYAIRSGTIKSYTISEQGEQQITAFHLTGDLVGFDAINNQTHLSYAQALETSMVCEIPYEILDKLSGEMPKLRQQIMRLMSCEIQDDKKMHLMLSQKNAEQRFAAFILSLSTRYAERGFSAHEFQLSMTRGDIGNYLNLTLETVSRLLGRLRTSDILKVSGKHITILDYSALENLAEVSG